MTDSLNKVTLIGNIGDDPEIIEFQNGVLASFNLATSHSWIDNKTRERKINTDWHKIVVYGDGLVGIIKKLNVKKGTKLFIEGKLTHRKWIDKNNNKRTTSEIILQGFNCLLIVLGNKQDNKEITNTEDDFDAFVNNNGFGEDELMF